MKTTVVILTVFTLGLVASAQRIVVGSKKFTESYVLGEIAKTTLRNAGFAAVEIIDTRADLNSYAKIESQNSCCTASTAPSAEAGGCCTPASDDMHRRLIELLKRYNVNDFAASVRVFAVKP